MTKETTIAFVERAAKAAVRWTEVRTKQLLNTTETTSAAIARLTLIFALISALTWPAAEVTTASAMPTRVSARPITHAVSKRRDNRAALLLRDARSQGFDDVSRYIVFRESGIRVPARLPQDHLEYMLEMSATHAIPKKIMFRLIQSESEFKRTARSRCGAQGYMQLMPSTKRQLVRENDVPRLSKHKLNIYLGAMYLRSLFVQARKHVPSDKRAWRVALACYNAGPDNVFAKGYRVPSYCKAYVDNITSNKPPKNNGN